MTSTTTTQAIVAAVKAIPEGFVRTYGDISPRAPRLTGTILSHTQEDLPWWRVVRADGTMAVGEEQRVRLEQEGVPMLATDPPRVDMRVARCWGEPVSPQQAEESG